MGAVQYFGNGTDAVARAARRLARSRRAPRGVRRKPYPRVRIFPRGTPRRGEILAFVPRADLPPSSPLHPAAAKVYVASEAVIGLSLGLVGGAVWKVRATRPRDSRAGPGRPGPRVERTGGYFFIFSARARARARGTRPPSPPSPPRPRVAHPAPRPRSSRRTGTGRRARTSRSSTPRTAANQSRPRLERRSPPFVEWRRRADVRAHHRRADACRLRERRGRATGFGTRSVFFNITLRSPSSVRPPPPPPTAYRSFVYDLATRSPRVGPSLSVAIARLRPHSEKSFTTSCLRGLEGHRTRPLLPDVRERARVAEGVPAARHHRGLSHRRRAAQRARARLDALDARPSAAAAAAAGARADSRSPRAVPPRFRTTTP